MTNTILPQSAQAAQVGLTDDEARRMIEASKVTTEHVPISPRRAIVAEDDVAHAKHAAIHVASLAIAVLNNSDGMDRDCLLNWLRQIVKKAKITEDATIHMMNTMRIIPVCADCGSEGPLSSGLCQSCWEGQRR